MGDVSSKPPLVNPSSSLLVCQVPVFTGTLRLLATRLALTWKKCAWAWTFFGRYPWCTPGTQINDTSFGPKRPCFEGLTLKNRGHLGSRYMHPKGQNPKKPMKQTTRQKQSKTQQEIGSGLSVEMDSVGKDGKDNIYFCIISIRYIRVCYTYFFTIVYKEIVFQVCYFMWEKDESRKTMEVPFGNSTKTFSCVWIRWRWPFIYWDSFIVDGKYMSRTCDSSAEFRTALHCIPLHDGNHGFIHISYEDKLW